MQDNDLNLSVPKLSEPYTPNPAIVEGLVRRAQNIPFEDIPAALSLARKELYQINRTDLNGAQRAIAAQAYDKIYATVNSYYQSPASTKRFIQNTESSEYVELGQFTQELAFVYKHILQRFASLPNRDNEKAKFNYMAIHYISQFMLQSYDRYTWFAPVLWRELHSLYIYAEQEGYLSMQISDPLHSSRTQSIFELYTQTCTIALADPYHLRPKENWVLFKYLRQWANHIEVLPPIPGMALDYSFCIDLQKSERPMPASELSATLKASQRWLTVAKLMDLMDLHKDQLLSGTHPEKLGLGSNISKDQAIRLLDTLLAKWGHHLDRTEPRYQNSSEIQIIWTLNDIYTYLSPEMRRFEVLKRAKLNNLKKARGESVNVSKNGMRLTIKGQDIDTAVVGQLVLVLRKNQDKLQSRIGFIAWSTKSRDNSTSLGVRLIPGNAQAVDICADPTSNEHRKGIIMVSARPYGNTIDSLLTPTDLLEISDQAHLSAPRSDDSHGIEVTTLLDRTGSFDQFKFEPIFKPIK